MTVTLSFDQSSKQTFFILSENKKTYLRIQRKQQEMGNEGSTAQTIESELSKILYRLTADNIAVIDTEIRMLFFSRFDENRIEILATLLFRFACSGNPDNYVQLAQRFFSVEYQYGANQRGTFKEKFLKIAIDKFESHESRGVNLVTLASNDIDFYAKLYDAGIVSPNLVVHWLVILGNSPALKQRLLTRIKPTVIRSSIDIGEIFGSEMFEIKNHLRRHGLWEE